ncbi:hypothetical protein [Gryllotalpicola protaetiae]|uniref:Uncharacterized protein n=1 Tax=Gryllotalpicola protaetiae TaxID=2419771 RepID=A0A387C0W6_9MICO|nr:hypothetical protein [Gryllotalpicola protaetiae]AYG04171.1 hypothetical protein D7I44_11945 [Gryllotalpicola protaetiae]
MATDDSAAQRYAKRHFGNAAAQPKIVEYYTMRGWQPVWDSSLRLSPEACALVRQRGGVMVRVRHRFRTVQVTISRYLGEDRMPVER